MCVQVDDSTLTMDVGDYIYTVPCVKCMKN